MQYAYRFKLWGLVQSGTTVSAVMKRQVTGS
jgi:hypothetical protein